MPEDLTPRGKTLRWHTNHLGLTEDPPGSNSDHRVDGIRKAQIDCAGGGTWLIGLPWCGVWCFNGLQAAGVRGINYRMASVTNIEDDARAERGCYRGWLGPRTGWDQWGDRLFRGDLVVLFGRGVHVETVRDVDRDARLIRTNGGNTSSGNSGSQSNGGGSFMRWRSIDDVHGFALIDFPGGAVSAAADAPMASALPLEIGPASDDLLMADPEVRRHLTEPDDRSDPENIAHEYERTDQ
jgi:hypothetical protein